MRQFLIQTFRFVLFVLTQALIFNQIEFGFGIQLLIYPLFILLLPISINKYLLMIVAFCLGFAIDSISNTFGLHASSALFLAYIRPFIFKFFEPRDGYEEGLEPTIYNMEPTWLLYVFGSMLLLHHTWYFTIEVFKFNELLFVLQKILLSAPISLITSILIQLIFFKKSKK